MFRGITKDFIIYGFGSTLSKLSSLVLLPFFTYYFTPDEYGALELIIITTSLASILCLLQLESALSRFFYDYETDERKILISSLLIFSVILSFLFTALLWIFAEKINLLLFNENIFIGAYKIGILCIPLLCMNSFLIVVIRFTQNRLLFIKSQSILFFTTILVPVILVLYFSFKMESYFWGQLIGLFLSVFYLTTGLKDFFIKELKFGVVKTSLKYSIPLIPGVFSGWVNSYGSRFFMLSFLSLKEIGLYAVAIKIASIFQLIGGAFRMTWPQFFWKTLKQDKLHKKKFKDIHSILSTLITIILVLFIAFIEYFTDLFLDVKYHPAVVYIPIISFSFVLISFFTQVVGLGSSIKFKTQYNSYSFIFGTLINLLGLFIFLPKYGLFVVPVSLLSGSFVSLLFLWFFSEKFYPIGFSVKTTFLHFLIVLLNILVDLVYTFNVYEKMIILTLSIGLSICASDVIISKVKNVIK